MCVHPAIQGCMVFYQMVVLLSSPQHSVLKKSPKLLAALFQPWRRRIFHYKSIMHLKWGAVVSCPFVCVHKSTLDCPGSKTPLKLHKAVEYCFTFVLEGSRVTTSKTLGSRNLRSFTSDTQHCKKLQRHLVLSLYSCYLSTKASSHSVTREKCSFIFGLCIRIH